MFKIIKKSTYHELVHRMECAEEMLDEYSTDHFDLVQDYDDMVRKNTELEERLKKILSENEETSINIKISDDTTTATPVVKYSPVIVEKLIETGYLDDVTSKNTMAVQLALIQLAGDAIHQILDAFSEEIEE